MSFQGGGAAYNPAPVRVFSKFTWLGLLVSYLRNLFSLNCSLARYRFENKFSKSFVAKQRITSRIACLSRLRVSEHAPFFDTQSKNGFFEAGCPVVTPALAMAERKTSKVKRCNNNITKAHLSRFTVHKLTKRTFHFSHFTFHLLIKPSHFLPFQKPAFTMAEVLITLGIIGIVAAMTLPSLIGKYQFKVFEVGLKKQYSLLQNAINLGVNEEGFQYCYVYYPKGSVSYKGEIGDCELLKNYLVSTLKLKSYKTDIKEKYKKRDVVRAEGGNSINWNCSYDWLKDTSDVYAANDGTLFMFNAYTVPALTIIIDVNGQKGPNRWGYDVFFMGLSNHNDYTNPSPKILLTDEFCSIIEKGGRFPRAILRNQEGEGDINQNW